MSVFTACIISFGTVLILLSFMAVVMTLLTRIFPAPKEVLALVETGGIDSGTELAIAQAVTLAFPGARVSRIRELPR
ncbi:MAG: hypothetical protein KKF02_07375 [Proteobacteria bacterium]|nr:hypothetical protein [Pseudomonadota bacterium]